MIYDNEIDAMESFFKALQRPLPGNIKLNAAETVSDPEIFIQTQFSVLRSKRESSNADVIVGRLNAWKEGYAASAASPA